MIRRLALASASTLLATTALAEEPIRLGFMTTLSGPTAAIGGDVQRGMDIALQHLGGRLGGRDVEIITADDEGSAATAVEIAARFIDRDNVDLVTGLANSAVLMAGARPLLDAGKFVIASFSGPSPYAGAGCHENAFFVEFQNDQWAEGLGHFLNDQGVENLYVMALDYQAGWDHIAGIERTFDGEVVGQALTPFSQLDFTAEFAQMRVANPDALFVFYVGGPGVAFVRQFNQSGLNRRIPLYTLDALTDSLTLPALGESIVGTVSAATWSPALDNAANNRFVADFTAAYGRAPTSYAQGQYDAMMLIDSALRATGGDIADADAFRAALRAADFDSVRGPFAFNNNHMPIQNVYVQRIIQDESGIHPELIGVAIENAEDSYHQDCPLE